MRISCFFRQMTIYFPFCNLSISTGKSSTLWKRQKIPTWTFHDDKTGPNYATIKTETFHFFCSILGHCKKKTWYVYFSSCKLISQLTKSNVVINLKLTTIVTIMQLIKLIDDIYFGVHAQCTHTYSLRHIAFWKAVFQLIKIDAKCIQNLSIKQH